ncbi:MAG: DNA polymerase III subunit delta [Rhodobacteraceae bacterium]|jgi:DNA polymerase-3 subunit delta|nr:DNA polymerase III subunit delta [Paracoccaceae bacterium]
MKLNPRELSKLVEKPDPTLAAVLFYGSDTMRVALKRQEYLENLLGPNAEQEMRLTRFIGDDILKDRTAVFDAVKSVGFFPGQRAVLIENTSDKTSKIIIECIEAWNKTDAHIVVTSGLLRPTSQLRKAFETFQNTLAAPIYDNPLTEMEIKTELTRAGIQINDPAIMDALYNLSKELEPGDFRNTLEKIYLYKLSDKSPLTAKDISMCSPISAEANLEEIIHAVSGGNTNKINHILNRLEAQGVQPVTLCLSFQRHFKLLLNLKNHGGTPLEAISSYKPPIFGPKRNAIINQLKLWNEETLKIALSFFVELDLDLRSATNRYPSLAMTERVLIRVAMIARR